MNITFIHDLDTGFMASTLKPAFKALGHECTVIQMWSSWLEPNTDHIDYDISDTDINTLERVQSLQQEYKETDLFIIRLHDETLKALGVVPYLNEHNTVFRLHGHDLLYQNRPYSLKTWRINWYNKEPFIATYNDPTFIGKTPTRTVFIERPINLDIIPKRKRSKKRFALTSPSGMIKKGAQELLETWKEGPIPLTIVSQTDRTEALELKSRCSYLIDNLNPTYHGGPYGMNSVEAWLMRIPVFSMYSLMSEVVCPELPSLVTHVTLDTVQDTINSYTPDRKRLNNARKYALHTHDPVRIAQQYINLAKVIEQ